MDGNRCGDDDFADFVAAQTPALLGLARALTGNDHDAWDLVQEALFRVGKRWSRASMHNPAGYVRTVLVRLNVDRFRRLRRELTTAELPDQAATSVQREGELGAWLTGVLPGLSPRQRTVLALRFVADLDTAEIARELGCSEGSVRSHLSRGLARLREQLPAGHTTEKEPSR